MNPQPPNAAIEARHRRRLLARRDLPCEACGYNLRGCRGELCPECGAKLELARLRERIAPAPGEVHQPEPWQLRFAPLVPWLWAGHLVSLIVNMAWILVWGNEAGEGCLFAGMVALAYGWMAIPLFYLHPGVRAPPWRKVRMETGTELLLFPLTWLFPALLGLLLHILHW